jgi:D-glycero-D-manno-heptose 1,7-bisphosphate phosphatase
MNKALFLDRDGTINIDKHYVYKKEDFILINGICDVIKRYNQNKYIVIVVTNQSGVARGLFTEQDVIILHEYANQLIQSNGAYINKWYYCPHHPLYGINQYKINCNCRKPNTGMLEQAIKDFNIDIEQSLLVGDKPEDIECGNKMGIKSIYTNKFINSNLN